MSDFTEDDYLTPPELLKLLGPFDLDPAAPVVRPWSTAKHHFTIEDDGLNQTWFGRVWLNPPYAKVPGCRSYVQLWMEKMAKHGNGISLTNSRTETIWFHDYLWNGAYALLFCKSRMEFYRPDGTFGHDHAKNAQVLAAYTHEDAEVLYRAHRAGPYVPVSTGKFVPLVVRITAQFTTTWRQMVRWLLRECGGEATLEQLYELAQGHPKLLRNPNWKAKIRQRVQEVGERRGPGRWRLKSAV